MTRVTATAPTTPHSDADAGEPRALADDQREHVPAARAERHADADLLRALRHGIRQHAVDADRRPAAARLRRRSRTSSRTSRYCQNVFSRASSPVWMLNSGSVGSTLRISWRTALVIDGRRRRRRRESSARCCAPGRTDTARTRTATACRRARENSRKSLTTPMTVIHSFCLSSSSRNRWPTTSLRFGHIRFANTPLTIATPDRPCPSASVKSRPATSGRLSVFSRCGVTPKYDDVGSWPCLERHALGHAPRLPIRRR